MNRLAIIALLVTGSAIANAAPPSLDDLVKECEKYELPFPPQGTKFVIFEWGYDHLQDEVSPSRICRRFAFLTQLKSRTNIYPKYCRDFDRDDLPPYFRVRVVPAEPESLVDFREEYDFDELAKAIIAEKLGHHRLAEFLFKKISELHKDTDWMAAIQTEAFRYWYGRLEKPDYDRPNVIRNLKRLIGGRPEDLSLRTREVIASLELAEQHRPQRAHPIDRLIDQLTEKEPEKILDQIRDFGFDAIPHLISSLSDRRLTRSVHKGGSIIIAEFRTIGDLTADLLDQFAGQEFPREEATPEEMDEIKKRPPIPLRFPSCFRPAQKAPIEAWFQVAKAKGEKPNFLDRLFAKTEEPNGQLDSTALAVIAWKFPNELPSIYRRTLNHEKAISSSSVISAILNSKSLTDDVKRGCLQLGIGHRIASFRDDAFYALAQFDPKAFDARLHELIKLLPDVKWDNQDERDECDRLMMRCYQSQDPAIWPAMARSLRRCPAWVCVNFLEQCSVFHNDSHRQDQIRMLAAFLHDRSVRPVSDITWEENYFWNKQYGAIEVRQFVCYQLSYFFGEVVLHDLTRTPDEWAFIYKWIETEVEKELGKPAQRKRP